MHVIPMVTIYIGDGVFDYGEYLTIILHSLAFGFYIGWV